MNTWHKRLTLALKDADVRPTDLAKGVGVSNATVSDWESGETKKIEGENLLKVCDFLDISPNWLLFGRGEMRQYTLTTEDAHAVKLNRMLGTRERKAWYQLGDSLTEPKEGTNGDK